MQTSKTSHFPIFAFLWAMAIFMHVGKWNMWLISPACLLVGVLAIGVLLKPNSVPLFLALAVAQFFQAFQTLPWIPNHWFLITFIHLSLLFVFFRLAFSERSLQVNEEKFYSVFAPMLRWILLLIYFVTLFHKLNYDWFDPSVSCGSFVYLDLVKRYPFLQNSPWAQMASIYGTLLAELLIPVFLVWPRFRTTGIFAGIALHFIFGIADHFAFSAMMLALLFLYVPDNFRLPPIAERFLSSSQWNKMRMLAGLGVISLALFVCWKSPWRKPGTPPWSNLIWDLSLLKRGFLSHAFQSFWFIYAPSVFLFFAWVLRLEKPVVPSAKKILSLSHKSLIIILFLFLLNGFSPYLGVKTGTTLSMFSNLRITGKDTNHLILRKDLDLFGYSSDLVKVLSSSDPELQEAADKGYLLPYFEFRYYLSQKMALGQGDFRLSYVRKGVEKTFEQAADDPELSNPYPLYLRKLLYFRPVPTGEKCPCQH